MGYICHCCWPC